MKLPRSIRLFLHQTNLRFDAEFCLAPPIPAKAKTKPARLKKDDNTFVLRSGVHITRSEDDMEWMNTTPNIGKDKSRNSVFTEFDAIVLEQDKYAGLDVDKYRVLKTVWADNISAKKAETDYRVQNLEDVALTIRTLYWAAFAEAHRLEQKAGEGLAKSTV